jgi:acyl-CoA synthetase (AMP-forming)/AMP-acid ligase II
VSANVNAIARVSSDAALACPQYPPHIESLIGVLAYQAASSSDRVVCRRIRRERHRLVTDALTLAALREGAMQAAAMLQAAGVREGDRVILSLSDPHDFLVAFVAALGLGASAVPLPTVAESGAPRSFAARVHAVSRDCGPAAAVVESAERFAQVVGEVRPHLPLLELRDLRAATAEAAVELRDQPAARRAFIQYTSGSTGAPKGVVVTHGNLIANCGAIRDATAYSRADRMVSWLPLHHDMGLVGGLLTSIYCAAESCLMPPLAFVARPVTWLEAISCCGASLTVGPTFAYSLCARKIPEKQLAGIDLSSLRLAYVGAEPVDPTTLAAFTDRFAAFGLSPNAMYPVYGLAEATLAVAFPRPGSPIRYDTVDRRRLATAGVAVPVASDDADGVTFVSVGGPLPRLRVEIVGRDADEPLADREVGELVVSGASVSPRYFAEGNTVCRTTVRTGDLAYVADGHVYIVDRIKDLVIIGGQNYAPSDIEAAAAGTPGLRRGRIVAFSAADGAGTAGLHIVAEVTPESWRPARELEGEVRRRVRAEIGLSPASVTVVAPGTLERTSSGKIKRRACAEAYQRGALRTLRARDRLLYRVGRALRRGVGWISGRLLSRQTPGHR